MRWSSTTTTVILLLALALTPRLIFWVEWNQAGLLSLPVVDARTYDQEARGLLDGTWPASGPFWQAPLYSFFLAGIYRVVGVNWGAARLANALLGVGTCLLVWFLARRLLSSRQAWIAFGVCALYGPLLYFEGQLLRESLSTFLLMAWLIVQLRAIGQAAEGHAHCVRWWLVSGILLGLTALCRENALILVPLTVLWGLSIKGGRRRWLRPGVFLLGVCLTISPVTLYNLRQEHSFIPISSSGGINFFLGNNPDSRQTVAIRPGRFWNELTDTPRREIGAVTAAQQSGYFYREAFGWIVHHPVAFFRNSIHKTASFLSAHEIKRNQEIYEGRQGARLLRVLMWKAGPFGFPFGLLAPVALLGIWLVLRKRMVTHVPRDVRFLTAAALLFALGIILFFPSARYRVPLVPIFAILAVGGIASCARALRESVIVLAVALALVNSGAVRVEEDPADQAFLRATALAEAGRTDEALSELRFATVANPRHGEAWTTMAALYGMTGRLAESMGAAFAALAIDSTDAMAWVNLGTAFMDRGDLATAEHHLRRALQLQPNLAEAWNNLGMLLVRRGQREEALRAFDQALKIDPTHAKAAANRRRYVD